MAKKTQPINRRFYFVHQCISRPSFAIDAASLEEATQIYLRDHMKLEAESEEVESEGLEEVYDNQNKLIPKKDWPPALTHFLIHGEPPP